MKENVNSKDTSVFADIYEDKRVFNVDSKTACFIKQGGMSKVDSKLCYIERSEISSIESMLHLNKHKALSTKLWNLDFKIDSRQDFLSHAANKVILENTNKKPLYSHKKQGKIPKKLHLIYLFINTKSKATLTLHYLYKSIYRILSIFLFSLICSIYAANANTLTDSNAKTGRDQQNKTTQSQKVQIKGDTLVIQDASCQSGNKSLLKSLQTKDSKNTTTLQECDDINHK
ncbi:hypothetical protein [Helicobacter bilis]|uniref:hypothetical protein n=1 Tax=Helicobacter bilis TaxID=37372 RepID=UPI00051D454F|nr:hypothetical protein [Helicobacter bilis]TLE10032.1 hypothetical protein LS78_000980 [Helicobacter bilis]